MSSDLRAQLAVSAQRLAEQDYLGAAAGARQVLERDPGQADAQHLLGVALIGQGEVQAGARLLEALAERQPGNPEIPYNYGSALLRQDEAAAALAQFDRALTLNPDHVQALNNRGTALLLLRRSDEARDTYREVLKRAPEHASAWFNLANLEAEAGAAAAAQSAYRRALALRPDYFDAQLNLGQLLLNQGDCRQAERALREATRIGPTSAGAFRLLGQALAGSNQFEAAVTAARRATELDPDSAQAWNSLGAQLTSLGQLEESEAALRRALELDSGLVSAWSNLAALLELANRREESAAVVDQARVQWPGDPGLALTRARLSRRAGNEEDALAALADLDLSQAPATQQREAHFLLGQLKDRLGAYPEAFDHYLKGNRIAAREWLRGNPPADTLLPAMNTLAATVTEGFVADWPAAGEQRSPAFLLSFQRSGTTLLDTLLGARGDVTIMEELPVVNAVIRDVRDYPRALAGADEATLDGWRRSYFRQADALLGRPVPEDELLLDKSPLNTVHLPLIQRLFPGAPIILALRHPLDVVLSCFMQDFTLSSFMLNYTDLTSIARVYQRVMSLYQHYRRVLPLNVHEIRYETLVQEPEPALRSLVDFLGLRWSAAMLDHTTHAQDRGLINTPSYHQVTQPIYQSSAFRWVNYAEQLKAVRPVLEPFCEAFGYRLDPSR
ncbi:MAG: sulfotransferase [Pseudomonadota bacterium]